MTLKTKAFKTKKLVGYLSLWQCTQRRILVHVARKQNKIRYQLRSSTWANQSSSKKGQRCAHISDNFICSTIMAVL